MADIGSAEPDPRFNSEMARAYAGCPSTLITRGRWRPAPDKAKRRKSLAAVRSRFGDSMKSIVSPAESTARYRYVQVPATFSRVGGGARSNDHAGLRPPLKLHVQFSRMQLSRGALAGRARAKVKCQQTDKPQLAIQFGLRQLLPATAAPTFASVRPKATHDPSIEVGEKLADVSPLVVVAPTTQLRIELVNQLLGSNRRASAGKLAHLFLEAADRFLSRIRIQRPRRGGLTQRTVP